MHIERTIWKGPRQNYFSLKCIIANYWCTTFCTNRSNCFYLYIYLLEIYIYICNLLWTLIRNVNELGAVILFQVWDTKLEPAKTWVNSISECGLNYSTKDLTNSSSIIYQNLKIKLQWLRTYNLSSIQ